MAETIYISDTGNNRIIERTIPDLAYVAEFNDAGYLLTPRGLCNDGASLYLMNGGTSELLKYTLGATIADLVFVSGVGLGYGGSGDDEFDNPWGICTDNTNLYIVDKGNLRIVKRLCSDLSYLAQVSSFNGGDIFYNPCGVSTDGTHIYVTDWRHFGGNQRWIIRFLCSDLSFVSKTNLIGGGADVIGVDIIGSSVFTSEYISAI